MILNNAGNQSNDGLLILKLGTFSSSFSLNSIYFQISIYTWQHTAIQIHGKWIGKQVT